MGLPLRCFLEERPLCSVFDVLFSRFSRLKIANFDFNVKCRQIAEVTEGLSGREISKIAIAWQVS